MSDLKAPTYKYRSPVGRAFMVRRLIFSRSDIFKRRYRTEDVGPEGTDLQIPIPVGRAFTVRRFIFFAERHFQKVVANRRCRT
jgi:hypothetical protein